MSSTPEEPNQPPETPAGATPPGTPPSDPPPPAPPAGEPAGAGPEGTDPEQRRALNPLLALLLAVVVIAGAYVLLSGGDDDVNETIVPPPTATTPAPAPGEQPGATTPQTTPGDDQPGETPTTPEGGVTPGGDEAAGPSADAAKTAVRTLVPLIQACYGETNSYEACLTHPTVVGSGVSIAADPQPGQVRLKATADTFAIVAPDAGGRNWVFKKNAGVPSTRTCEERGEAKCESKRW